MRQEGEKDESGQINKAKRRAGLPWIPASRTKKLSNQAECLVKDLTAQSQLALESWTAWGSSSTGAVPLALPPSCSWRPVVEALPHHCCVFRPRRAQLHLEILPKHVDSIEGADDREWELGKDWELETRAPQFPPP